jgi:3-oxoacyl-(acyl-carrier-protein) synthase
MILNAKGPNSNYVSGDTSGLIALCNGAWKISDGKLKAAVVGGYSMSSDPVIMSMLKKQGLLHNDDQSDASITIGKNAGTIPADGSVFMLLESEESAKERESKILARFLSSGTSFSGRLRYLNQTSNTNEDSDAMLQAIEQCLKQAHAQNGLELKDVGLICMSGSGVSYIDDAEINAVSSLSAKVGRDIPAISISPKFGNLMESSGLLEVCLAKDMLSKSAELPPELFLKGKKLAIDPAKRVALVLRSSLAGDKVCIAFEIPID